MTRGLFALGVALVLAVVQTRLPFAPAVVSNDPGERAVAMLGGIVRPSVVQVLWLEAEAALRERRLFDAVDRLRLLEIADPGNWRAAQFRAFVLAHDICEREATDDVRVARVLEAMSVLDRAARATSEPDPLFALGQMLLEDRFWNESLSRGIERVRKESPRMIAAKALDEACVRAPGARSVALLAMEAWRRAGIEELMRRGDVDVARASFDHARAAAARLPSTDSAAAALVRAWAEVLDAVQGGPTRDLPEAGARLGALVARICPPGSTLDDSEAVFAMALPRVLVRTSEKHLARPAGGPAALSAIQAAHRIRALVEPCISRENRALVRSMVDQARWRKALDDIQSKDPSTHGAVAELRRELDSWRDE